MKKNLKQVKKTATVASPKRTLESVMAKKFEAITLSEDVVVNDGEFMLHAGDVIHVSKLANRALYKTKVVENKDKEGEGDGEAIDITDSLALGDEEDGDLGEPLEADDGTDDDADGDNEDLDDDDAGKPDGDGDEDDEGSDDDNGEDNGDDDDLSDLDTGDDDLADLEDKGGDSDEDGEDEAIDLLTSPEKHEEAKKKPSCAVAPKPVKGKPEAKPAPTKKKFSSY